MKTHIKALKQKYHFIKQQQKKQKQKTSHTWSVRTRRVRYRLCSVKDTWAAPHWPAGRGNMAVSALYWQLNNTHTVQWCNMSRGWFPLHLIKYYNIWCSLSFIIRFYTFTLLHFRGYVLYLFCTFYPSNACDFSFLLIAMYLSTHSSLSISNSFYLLLWI